ncbi:hypothetical protein Aduo_007749 [Ancylostoma duodenale]
MYTTWWCPFKEFETLPALRLRASTSTDFVTSARASRSSCEPLSYRSRSHHTWSLCLKCAFSACFSRVILSSALSCCRYKLNLFDGCLPPPRDERDDDWSVIVALPHYHLSSSRRGLPPPREPVSGDKSTFSDEFSGVGED